MSETTSDRFMQEREQLNEIMMEYSGLSIERFHSLDVQVCRQGALPTKTKELLGLVASLVLRCDDCIKYRIIRCYEEHVTREELEEALAIGLVVGGDMKAKGDRFYLPVNRVREIVDGPRDMNEKLKALCELLRDGVPY